MKQKLGFFASRWGIIAVGALIGIIAVSLQKFGNPANMGICMACFMRDVAGALGLHRAAMVQYLRPEIPALLLGAFIAAVSFGEFKFRTGSAPIIRFALGMFAMIGALIFLGCPWRALLRLAGGDWNAIIGIAGADRRHFGRRPLPEEGLFPRQEPAREQPACMAHPPGGGRSRAPCRILSLLRRQDGPFQERRGAGFQGRSYRHIARGGPHHRLCCPADPLLHDGRDPGRRPHERLAPGLGRHRARGGRLRRNLISASFIPALPSALTRRARSSASRPPIRSGTSTSGGWCWRASRLPWPGDAPGGRYF